MKLLFLTLFLAGNISAQTPLYDPFAKTAKVRVPKSASLLPPPSLVPRETPIIVSAVMNDKAHINGQWHKVGDTIHNKELSFIRSDFVGLKEGSRLIMIGVGTQRRVLTSKEIQ